jgi:hypothetical protein
MRNVGYINLKPSKTTYKNMNKHQPHQHNATKTQQRGNQCYQGATHIHILAQKIIHYIMLVLSPTINHCQLPANFPEHYFSGLPANLTPPSRPIPHQKGKSKECNPKE